MEHTALTTDAAATGSNRLVHRLAARELTREELDAVNGGMRRAGCGSVSCSAGCCDDSDM